MSNDACLECAENTAKDGSGKSRRRRRVWFAAAAVSSVGLLGGLAYAAIPDSGTKVITACYPTGGGQLRVIDYQSGARCGSGESTLTWNQAGIKYRGTWNSTTAYKVNDVVTSGGSAYIATKNNTNVAVSNATTWAVLAQKGSPGPQGPTGPSNGYLATSDSIPTGGFSVTQVLSLALPTGSYVVNVKVNPINSDTAPRGYACYLYLNGAFVDDFYSSGASGYNTAVVDTTALSLSAAGTVTVGCLTDASGGSFDRNRITAIRVGTLTGAAAPAQTPKKRSSTR